MRDAGWYATGTAEAEHEERERRSESKARSCGGTSSVERLLGVCSSNGAGGAHGRRKGPTAKFSPEARQEQSQDRCGRRPPPQTTHVVTSLLLGVA